MNLFSSQLLMWRGSSDDQEDGGEGCDVLSASPEAGVQLLHRLVERCGCFFEQLFIRSLRALQPCLQSEKTRPGVPGARPHAHRRRTTTPRPKFSHEGARGVGKSGRCAPTKGSAKRFRTSNPLH